MAEITVTDDGLHGPDVAEYLSRSDPRVLTGFRVALEVLGIPLPLAARRKPAGRPPLNAYRGAFYADNPALARADRDRRKGIGKPAAHDGDPLNGLAANL